MTIGVTMQRHSARKGHEFVVLARRYSGMVWVCVCSLLEASSQPVFERRLSSRWVAFERE